MNEATRNFIFSLLVMLITLSVIVALVLMAFPMLERRYSNEIVALLAAQMSEEERQELYNRIGGLQAAMFDVVPEPDVARIGQAGVVVEDKQSEVVFNNAGMRSVTDYEEKQPDTFRIVCLGDSFVFGTAGREEDRFCNQMAEYYDSNRVTVDGRRIETLAVGLGSWTTVQETTYLASRLTGYDPDLVLLLATTNDITASTAVTGKGLTTLSFSPDQRVHGSGMFLAEAPFLLGHRTRNLVLFDLTSEAGVLWARAMASIKRLVDVQSGRGKLIVVSVLDENPSFSRMFLHNYYEAGIQAPVFLTNYFRGAENSLPHDAHPNRQGHAILSNHFVNVLHSLGWVPLAHTPDLHEQLSVVINPVVTDREVEDLQKWAADEYLLSRLDFERLTNNSARAVMGGLFLEGNAGEGRVWASPRSSFLLRAGGGEEMFHLDIGVPDRPELFPATLKVHLNDDLAYAQPLAPGRSTLRVPLEGRQDALGIVEVRLEASRYFAGITDHRMKSFRLYSAGLQ